MKNFKSFLILSCVALSGCHWVQPDRPKKDDLTVMPGNEKRTVASSPEGLELYADYDRQILAGKCSDQIQARIKLYRAERSWVKGPPDMDGSSTFLSPTTMVGRWIGVRKFQSGELQFLVLTRNKMEIYSYSPTCTFTKDERNRAFSGTSMVENGEPALTDRDLENLMDHLRFGIIYVWSPSMAYSYTSTVTREGAINQSQQRPAASGITNAHEAMMKVAEKLRVAMAMTVVVDPAASRANIKTVFEAGNHDLKPDHLRKMASLEMMMRSMGQHYPSIMVYGNGKIYRQMRPGVSATDNYQQFIEDAVTALQK